MNNIVDEEAPHLGKVLEGLLLRVVDQNKNSSDPDPNLIVEVKPSREKNCLNNDLKKKHTHSYPVHIRPVQTVCSLDIEITDNTQTFLRNFDPGVQTVSEPVQNPDLQHSLAILEVGSTQKVLEATMTWGP